MVFLFNQKTAYEGRIDDWSSDVCSSDLREETDGDGRAWLHWAVGEIEADAARSADTHLIKMPLAGLDGIQIYFKDESTHPSGSLKHRLARSLLLYALCNGWVRKGTPVIEASSGSTAISEAYLARPLGQSGRASLRATVGTDGW